MTIADRDAFATYCVWHDRHITAEWMVRRQGAVLETSNGNLVPNPWLTISRQASETKKAYAIELGLTPSARARMGSTIGTPRTPNAADDEPPSTENNEPPPAEENLRGKRYN